jgi:hypothetical protein
MRSGRESDPSRAAGTALFWRPLARFVFYSLVQWRVAL